jgi:hypothetical protein
LLGEWTGTNLIGYGKESKSFIAETTTSNKREPVKESGLVAVLTSGSS